MPDRNERDRRAGGLLGAMRIRKKLIVLHTIFSLALAVILLVSLRPAVIQVVIRAEMDEAMLALRLMDDSAGSRGASLSDPNVVFARGTASELALSDETAREAVAAGGQPVPAHVRRRASTAVRLIVTGDSQGGLAEPEFLAATVTIPESRLAVLELYAFVVLAVLGVYGLIAAALELFVLPQNVYGPIRRMLDADHALQTGDSLREIIEEEHIPADELGEIMRSRNESVLALRRHELDLAEALQRIELVATDLKRKNHLLEAARRNLADADRLASLGMMSAGIAHELNTPLTVVKGLAEKLESSETHALREDEAALLGRVVRRLERLGESLLDFARVRPPERRDTRLAPLVDEASTLVRLDREMRSVQIVNRVDEQLVLSCDGDRIIQVLVNLIRNSVDAMRETGSRVVVEAGVTERDGAAWVSLTITDDGPGIDASVLETLFEPFVSSRLDARGTGLGLAVAEGIVQEHGGVILARNRADTSGAVLEVVLPVEASGTLGGLEEGDG